MADREIRIKVVVDEKGSISRLGSNLSGAQKSATGLVGSLRGLTGVLGIIAASGAVRAIAGLGAASVQAARDAERIRVVLTAATGSAALAAAEFDRFSEISNRLGLSIRESADDFAKFLAAARGTALEGDKAAKIFENVASAMSGLQLSGEQSSRILAAMQQIISKGTVSSEELRVQLGDLLPGAMQVAAQSVGVTTAEFQKMLARGEVLAEDFLPKFAELLATRFPAAVDSTQATFNRLNNTLFELQSDIGDDVLPALVRLAEQLEKMAADDSAGNLADAIGRAIAFMVDDFGKFVQTVEESRQQWAEDLEASAQFFARWSQRVDDALNGPLGTIAKLVPGVRAHLEQLRKSADESATALQKASNAVSGDLARAFERFDASKVKGDFDEISDAALAAAAGIETLADTERDFPDAAKGKSAAVEVQKSKLEELTEKAQSASESIDALTFSEEKLLAALPKASSTGIDEIADAVSDLAKNLQQLDAELKRISGDFGQLLKDSFEGAADALANSLIGAVAEALTGGDVEAAMAQFGDVLASVVGQAVSSSVSASLEASGSSSATAAIGGSFAGAIVGIVFTGVLNGLVDMFTGSGTRVAENIISVTTGQFEAALQEGADTLRPATQAFVDVLNAFVTDVSRITGVDAFAALTDVTIDLGVQFEDDEIELFFVKLADGIDHEFDTFAEAVEFAADHLQEVLANSGLKFDQAVRDLLENFEGNTEQFLAALEKVQGLEDQAKISLDGLTSLQIEMQKLPGQLASLARELEGFGLSAASVERLVGGQMVASFQAWREAITGVGLSVEEQRAQKIAEAELFNAEKALRIAELEARKQKLLADAGLTQAEIDLANASLNAQAAGLTAEGNIAQAAAQLAGNVLDGRAKFVRAEGALFQAEAGVMAGFVQVGAGIVQTGAELIGGFADVIGDIAPEIAKQIEAIQKVIDALRRIPDIRPGDIRIPGVPGPRGGGRGGGGVGDPFAGLQGLLDRLFPLRAAMRQLREESDLLAKAFARGKIDEETYREGLDRLNEEFREFIAAQTRGFIDDLLSGIEEQERLIQELSGSLQDLADFLADLRLSGGPTPLRPAQQILALQQQLQQAAAAAAGGDLDAIREFQDIARRLQQLGGEAFGTGTAGFEALLDFIETLGQDILDEGNDLLESELDHLADMRDSLADLLEANLDLHNLTQEEINAIREGNADLAQENRNIKDELELIREQNNDRFNELIDEIARLRRELADAA